MFIWDKIKDYRFASKGKKYLTIDEKGIIYEEILYLWGSIDTIKYETYPMNGNMGRKLQIQLVENEKKISILLSHSNLNSDIDEIAAYINKYWKK